MGLVFGCIAPHGGIAIAEACEPDELPLAAVTRRGMEELGRRFDRAKPEVAIVLTPHNVHVDGAMAVVTAGNVSGALEGHPDVKLRLMVDRPFALAIRDAFAAEGIPVAGVSYGANDAAAASFPMHWAVLAAGKAIARAAAASNKRVALIASCDHGHGHDADGPYGFTPKSKEFDDAVVALIRRDDLSGLMKMDPRLPIEAKADSYWQMLMLQGALADGQWKGEFLSYEAPTYFGMLCASYERQMAVVERSLT